MPSPLTPRPKLSVTCYGFATLIEKGIGKLLEKVLEAGHRVLVVCPTSAYATTLDTALWTYHPSSFLPHGLMDAPDPDLQPILLTYSDAPSSPGTPIPNGADVGVLVCPQGCPLNPLADASTSPGAPLPPEDLESLERLATVPFKRWLIATEGPLSPRLSDALTRVFSQDRQEDLPEDFMVYHLQTPDGRWVKQSPPPGLGITADTKRCIRGKIGAPGRSS